MPYLTTEWGNPSSADKFGLGSPGRAMITGGVKTMKQNNHKPRIRGEVLTVDREGLRRIIDKEARKNLGLSGQEALGRIQSGHAGDNHVWSHLSMLAGMLR